VTLGDEEVQLTPIEFRLLAALARHAGRVLTHDALLREVWGPGAVGQNHYLRVYMAQLRRKIEADPARPEYLLTELVSATGCRTTDGAACADSARKLVRMAHLKSPRTRRMLPPFAHRGRVVGVVEEKSLGLRAHPSNLNWVIPA
jgi:hypothetical protein